MLLMAEVTSSLSSSASIIANLERNESALPATSLSTGKNKTKQQKQQQNNTKNNNKENNSETSTTTSPTIDTFPAATDSSSWDGLAKKPKQNFPNFLLETLLLPVERPPAPFEVERRLEVQQANNNSITTRTKETSSTTVADTHKPALTTRFSFAVCAAPLVGGFVQPPKKDTVKHHHIQRRTCEKHKTHQL